MKIIHKGTYTAHFLNSDTCKNFPNLATAQKAAEDYCGNDAYNKIPSENTYLYGPGDGTTSVQIREDIDFDMEA